MIRSLLTLVGAGGIGYALYNYYNKQLALALEWEFKIKKVQVKNITKNGATLNLTASVLNKSAFSLEVKDYIINLYYKGVQIGTAQGDIPFNVNSDSWFDVPVIATIPFEAGKGILDDVGIDLITKKPILIDVKGDMNVVFANLERKVILNVKDVVLSQNLAGDIGIGKPIDKVTGFLNNLGIKL
tara:strand:+ start:423 stop:977 length:555 start_codon:yes stop_codon:yes gene_type:complete